MESTGDVIIKVDRVAEKARLIAKGCTLVEEDPTLPRLYLRNPYGLVFNITRA